MNMSMRWILGSVAVVASLTAGASAANLFAEDFEADPTASWTVNKSGNDANQLADFYFDYSSVGIPSAPNSGGSTRGLKLQANKAGGVFSGLSVSPTGQSFAGDYSVQFDAWLNFNGPMPGGGNGSTQIGTWGIGTSGTAAQWAGGTQKSLYFGTTLDGGSAVDYRAYSSAAATGYVEASGIFAAGNTTGVRNNSHAYYTSRFLGAAAPAAQLAAYPGQTGTAAAGTLAFAWRDMLITKTGAIVTWHVDGHLIATVDSSAATLDGGNILFGHFDSNGGSTTDPNADALLFTLIDNVRVAPEPTTALFLALGAVGLFRRRR